MAVDAKTVSTIAGALFGASLLEDDRDLFGTMLGLAIGGIVGSQLEFDAREVSKAFVIKKDFSLVGEEVEGDVERLKKEISGLKVSDLDNLPSDPTKDFDPNKPLESLTRENIKDVAKNSNDLETLRKLKNFVENPVDTLTEVDVKDLPTLDVTGFDKYLHGESSLSQKEAALTQFFRDRGYRGQELKEKMDIFSNILDNGEHLTLSANSGRISAGGYTFKISSSDAVTGMSSYTDNSNFFSVQKLNPFASFFRNSAVDKPTGKAIASAIGLKFADAAKEASIEGILEKAAYEGMKPEDLKALLVSTGDITAKEINQLIDASYQHQIRESGMILEGKSQFQIEREATDLARRTSNIISIPRVFNLDNKTGVLVSDNPFRNIGTLAKSNTRFPDPQNTTQNTPINSEGSELRRFFERVKKEYDIPSVRHFTNPDDVASYTINSTFEPVNLLADTARKADTTASRGLPVSFSDERLTGTQAAFKELQQQGKIPKQYHTALALSRITISDETLMNENLHAVLGTDSVSLADGASIASRESFGAYRYQMTEKSSMVTREFDNAILSDKVIRNLELGNKLGGFLNAPEVSAIGATLGLMSRVNTSLNNIQTLNSNIASNNLAINQTLSTLGPAPLNNSLNMPYNYQVNKPNLITTPIATAINASNSGISPSNIISLPTSQPLVPLAKSNFPSINYFNPSIKNVNSGFLNSPNRSTFGSASINNNKPIAPNYHRIYPKIGNNSNSKTKYIKNTSAEFSYPELNKNSKVGNSKTNYLYNSNLDFLNNDIKDFNTDNISFRKDLTVIGSSESLAKNKSYDYSQLSSRPKTPRIVSGRASNKNVKVPETSNYKLSLNTQTPTLQGYSKPLSTPTINISNNSNSLNYTPKVTTTSVTSSPIISNIGSQSPVTGLNGQVANNVPNTLGSLQGPVQPSGGALGSSSTVPTSSTSNISSLNTQLTLNNAAVSFSGNVSSNNPLSGFTNTAINLQRNLLNTQGQLQLNRSDLYESLKDLVVSIDYEKSKASMTDSNVQVLENLRNKILPLDSQGVPMSLSDLKANVLAGNLGDLEDYLKDYSELSQIRYKPEEFLGVSSSGLAVKAPDTMSEYSLETLRSRVTDLNSSTVDFVFTGRTNLNENTPYRKVFSASAKEVVQMYDENVFENARSLALLESLGIEVDKANRSFTYNGQQLSFNDVKQMVDSRPNFSTDVITLDSGAGLGIASDTLESYSKGQYKDYLNGTYTNNAGKDISPNITQTLKDNLEKVGEYLEQQDAKVAGQTSHWSILGGKDASRSSGWALGMFTTAVTEGKSSAETVQGLHILGKRNIDTLLNIIENDPSLQKAGAASNVLSDLFKADIPNIDNLSISDLKTEVNAAFDRRVESTMSAFSSDFDKIISGEIFNPEHIDMFRLAYSLPKESLMIGFADISPDKNYQSGSGHKHLSHNMQSHLKNAGYTSEMLSYFGTHSAEDIYDYNTITSMNKKVNYEDTLNYFFENEGKDINYRRSLVRDLKAIAPEDAEEFLRSKGVYSNILDQNSILYQMETEVEGIKTLSIPKVSTSRLGVYKTEQGSVTRKPLSTKIYNLLEADVAHHLTQTEHSELPLKEAGKALKAEVVNTIASQNNPLLKDLMSLEAPNSSYSVVLPAGGELDKIRAAYPDTLFGGINEARAQIILEQSGIDMTNKTVADFISPEGILQTVTKEGNQVDMLSLMVREPGLSGNSGRGFKYYVMGRGGDTHAGIDESKILTSKAIYLSPKDIDYADLMYGDYDLDHTLLFNSYKQYSDEDYLALDKQVKQHTANRRVIAGFMGDLKLKGSSDKNIYSLDVAIQHVTDNIDLYKDSQGKPIALGTPEFREAVINRQQEYLEASNIKAGYRKIDTPQLVQLSTDLSDSVNTIKEINFKPITQLDKDILRGLSHGLVEGLIKMQHEETDPEVKQTSVEKLLQVRREYQKSPSASNKKLYQDSLNTTLTALTDQIQDPQAKLMFQDYVPTLIEAELNNRRDPRFNPKEVGDVPSNLTRMQEGDINTAIGVLEDIQEHTNLMEKDYSDTVDVERSAKQSYNNVKKVARETIDNNKGILALGAGALAIGSLMTQKDPDFVDHRPVRGDIGSMTLASNVQSMEQSSNTPDYSKGPSVSKVGYITPDFSYSDASRLMNQTMSISGSYNNLEQDLNQSMKKAIFGDNISNVRIDKSYDY